LRTGEYRIAAHLFLELRRMAPQTRLHVTVSRACLFTGAPGEALHQLCETLAAMGHGSTAQRLQHRLAAPETGRGPVEREGFLERFPRLYDIVNVASHTFANWRRAV
jgi:hypothetical protein